MRLPSRASAARRSGMSLVEVLVAMAVFIMSLAALGQLVQLGMDQAVDAERQTVATRLAQSKMAEIEAGAVAIDAEGEEITDQELAFDGSALWRWDIQSEQTDATNVYDVTVTISIKTGTFSVSLSQLVYDPAYLGTAAPATDPNATTSSTTAQGGNP